MNTPQANKFLEVLTPPVMSALNTFAPTEGASGDERLGELRGALITAVHDIDWEATSLQPMQARPNHAQSVITPRSYGNILVYDALKDCTRLIELAEVYRAGTEPLPEQDSTFLANLRNSHHTLLGASGLEEKDKNSLFIAAQNPGMAKFCLGLTLERAPIITGSDTFHHDRFEWNSAIRRWMAPRLRQQQDPHGCPAGRERVTTPEGSRMVMTHYLWQSVINVKYPQ